MVSVLNNIYVGIEFGIIQAPASSYNFEVISIKNKLMLQSKAQLLAS